MAHSSNGRISQKMTCDNFGLQRITQVFNLGARCVWLNSNYCHSSGISSKIKYKTCLDSTAITVLPRLYLENLFCASSYFRSIFGAHTNFWHFWQTKNKLWLQSNIWILKLLTQTKKTTSAFSFFGFSTITFFARLKSKHWTIYVSKPHIFTDSSLYWTW